MRRSDVERGRQTWLVASRRGRRGRAARERFDGCGLGRHDGGLFHDEGLLQLAGHGGRRGLLPDDGGFLVSETLG